jgi:hypothetical protein
MRDVEFVPTLGADIAARSPFLNISLALPAVTDGSCEFSVDGNLAHHMPKTAAPDHWPSLEALIYCRESHRCS